MHMYADQKFRLMESINFTFQMELNKENCISHSSNCICRFFNNMKFDVCTLMNIWEFYLYDLLCGILSGIIKSKFSLNLTREMEKLYHLKICAHHGIIIYV